MANQRKKGIERITLTIPDEMLTRLEEQAQEQGMDRLALMREALRSYLGLPATAAATATTGPLREPKATYRAPASAAAAPHAAVAPVAAAAKAKAKAAAKAEGKGQAKTPARSKAAKPAAAKTKKARS